MASSSSSSSSLMNYQVFLSFRGEDTRFNFTSHLYEALKGKGLDVFFDNEKLEKGKELSRSLIQAIEASKLSIVILSKDYASSKTCLAELSHIMGCQNTRGHIVHPIFYHVDPSHVQNLDERFKESFDKYSDRPVDEVKRWKAAFVEVGKIKGCHIKGGEGDRPETEHIKDIVEFVVQKLMKYQVFLSFGENTRLGFTSHLLKALEERGINVFFDNETLNRKSQAIAASNLSIIILSADYASSESCLAEVSDIMGHKDTQGHIVLPIFYHVNPSHVRHLEGCVKTSFDLHELKRLDDQVKQWKDAFVEVGELTGWHIGGGKSDRPETEYIKDIVEDVTKKLNSKSRSVSQELVGIDDQKQMILRLMEQEDSRIIGLWGIGGIGKTTLADVVYKEVAPKFDRDHCFLQNVSERMVKQGMESLRNEFLSEILNEKEICVRTPLIGSTVIQERLKNKRVLVVLDDVNDSDQIECVCVKHFGHGSKIIVTSRDRQVLKNGGANKIHEVKKLNENDSLQLFSTFAFKWLNPAAEFRDLSNKFVAFSQGSPLALKVLGSQLYSKTITDWESELDKLKEYVQPKISQILKSSFDRLDELEKNIFLDIAIFFKGEPKKNVETILSSCYKKGAVCGISNLVDKCLLDITPYGSISMQDMLEEMGKDIVCQEPKRPGKRRRLWNPKDVVQVLRCNKGTESIEGIKLDMSRIEIDNLRLRPTVLENMLTLRYIHFYNPLYVKNCWEKKLLPDQDVSLPDELRYLCWEYYPFKSLSSSFNPRNLVVLKLPRGDMEQLWNEDYEGVINLREIDLFYCKKLKKIPNLLRAVDLRILDCRWCKSLFELPCLNHLESLETFKIEGCHDLTKFPEVPNYFSELDLSNTKIEEVADSIEHLIGLKRLDMSRSKVKNVSRDISKLKSLCSLDLGYCKSLTSLSELPRYLRCLNANDCPSLEKLSFRDHNSCQFGFDAVGSNDDDDEVSTVFSNCKSLNQDSIDNIVANAMLQIQSLAHRWARKEWRCGREHRDSGLPKKLFCCFPGKKIPANKFEYQSENSTIILKTAPMGCTGSRYLAFAICLMADLTSGDGVLSFICNYQLTDSSGKKFRRDCKVNCDKYRRFIGDHVFILFSLDMVIEDKEYEEASFQFYIKDPDHINVEKCGVHVFYVDAERDASATKLRPWPKRQISYDGEEGVGGGPERLK